MSRAISSYFYRLATFHVHSVVGVDLVEMAKKKHGPSLRIIINFDWTPLSRDIREQNKYVYSQWHQVNKFYFIQTNKKLSMTKQITITNNF